MNRQRARGRNRRAIALLRQVLEFDPDDVDVAVRLADVLAAVGENFEAWSLFRAAGKATLRTRHHTKSLEIFREATRRLPFEFDAWRIRAELERKLGHTESAQLTLREARRQFRSRFDRAQAIEILRMLREVEPWDHEIVLDLASLYAQTDQAGRALRLLEVLAVHSEAAKLRAVRFAQWQISHSFVHMRLWLRVALSEFSGSGKRGDEVSGPLRVR